MDWKNALNMNHGQLIKRCIQNREAPHCQLRQSCQWFRAPDLMNQNAWHLDYCSLVGWALPISPSASRFIRIARSCQRLVGLRRRRVAFMQSPLASRPDRIDSCHSHVAPRRCRVGSCHRRIDTRQNRADAWPSCMGGLRSGIGGIVQARAGRFSRTAGHWRRSSQAGPGP